MDSVENARKAEQEAVGLYSGTGRVANGRGVRAKLSKGKMSKAAAVGVIALVLIVGLAVVIVGLPMIMIGAIDYNLQRTLGFSDTVAILEKQGEYITGEMLSKGQVPEAYASDLATNGVEVGQVTLAGEFVPTNTYIAGLSQEMAATELVDMGNGELAVRFKDEIITAGEFVAKVESDPELYAAYSKAADLSARYYYSSDVEKVYKEMGVSRGNFNSWKSSGDAKTDEEKFVEILTKMLDATSSVDMSGYNMGEDEVDEEGKQKGFSIGMSGEVGSVIDEVAEETTDEEGKATARAAELLNMALSSAEPYLAANAFMAVEEPIQRARIGDNGPVNEVMNMLNKVTEVSYVDVNTGQTVTKKTSILDTPNFVAAVSDAQFSKADAQSFSRDRVLKSTGQANSEIIKDTTVATDGKSKSNILAKITPGEEADAGTLKRAENNLEMVYTTKNSEVFASAIGGNRVVEGGSFISNTINLRVLGAMPTDEDTLVAYHDEVEEILARQAEAERATLSPFDISSPNTFLGNIVHKMASAMVQSSGSSSSILMNVVKGLSNLMSGASGLFSGTAIADGSDNTYATMVGSDCKTVESAFNVAGDLYCSSHNTSYTGYMHYTREDWVRELGSDSLEDNCGVKEDGEVAKFMKLAMQRGATVGVEDAKVCETWKSDNGLELPVVGLFASWLGIYEACDGVDLDIATGANYTLSKSNPNVQMTEKLSGYVLYDTVSALLSGTQSSVSVAREKYLAENPQDDSEAGVIARRSGMSLEDAQFLVDYVDTVIAKKNGVVAQFKTEGEK